ncbi:MAG: hypothetical protein ABJB11_19715 [Ferruginibacter sp.]
MPFKKNISGNPGGRKKGTVNKTTIDLRQWINSFIDENRSQIKKDWKGLEPKDRIILFEKLLKYSLPTLQATSLTTDFQTLSDEQLDIIINELKKAAIEPGK